MVGISDFSRVEIVSEFGGKGFGRVVVGVWVVVVQKEEEVFTPMLVEPVKGKASCLVGAAFICLELVGLLFKVVVIGVEALVKREL